MRSEHTRAPLPKQRVPALAAVALEGGRIVNENTGICTMNTKEKTGHTSTELRCQSCQRKLGEIAGTYRLAVKCPRCKQFNHFQAA